jgi:hypothetical protein
VGLPSLHLRWRVLREYLDVGVEFTLKVEKMGSRWNLWNGGDEISFPAGLVSRGKSRWGLASSQCVVSLL